MEGSLQYKNAALLDVWIFRPPFYYFYFISGKSSKLSTLFVVIHDIQMIE